MEVNFVEIESDSGEGRDGADGIARAGLPPADVSAVREAISGEDRGGARNCWDCWRPERACRLRSRTALRRAARSTYTTNTFELFRALQAGAEPGRDPRRRAGSVRENRLARERLGEERHPARLPHGRHRGHVDRRRAAAFFDKATYPVKQIHRRRRRAHRARRLQHSRRLLHRQRRHLHAADVHQRGR